MDRERERRLIRAAQRGSAEAADGLARAHAARVWRAALAITGSREMADEVSQEAMTRAFRSLRGFDARQPFAPWLHRIVLNCARDAVRRRRAEQPLQEHDLPVADRDRDGWVDLLGALAALDPDRRQVVVLRHVLGFTPTEIARIVGLPVGTVNSRLARGLADLRLHLGKGPHEWA